MTAGTDDDQPDGQNAREAIALMEKLGDKPWFIGARFPEAARSVRCPEKILRPVPARLYRAVSGSYRT